MNCDAEKYTKRLNLSHNGYGIKFHDVTKGTSQWHKCINGSLTQWGRVTHIFVSKLTIIGSDNGLVPSLRQAIIWTNAAVLLIRPFRTNFNEILTEFQIFPFNKMQLKMSSLKFRTSRPQCVKLFFRDLFVYPNQYKCVWLSTHATGSRTAR